jgi:fructokinase
MADVVAFGEALWDLLPDGPVLGGAPLNFAYRIGSLGHSAAMVSALGTDSLGDRALAQMKSLGMDTTFIQRKRPWPTGTVNVFVDAAGNPDFTINSPAAYDHIELDEALERLAARADCLCFGTLVQRTEGSRAALAGMLAGFRGRHALYDVNLRKECYSREVIVESLARCNVVKLNHDELAELAAMLGLRGRSIPERADSLIEQAGLEYCLVTMGAGGAYAAARAGEKTYCPAFHVRLVDTTGAGDAFTAGFLDGLLRNDNLKEACRRGSAMGALVAAQRGATQPTAPAALESMLASGDTAEVDPALAEYM